MKNTPKTKTQLREELKKLRQRISYLEQLETERKQREEEIQTQKAYLDQLFESAPEGIVMADKDGHVLRVNSEFTKLFGYETGEIQGQCLDELIVPGNHYKNAYSITKKVARGESVAFEAVRKRKDGASIDVSVLASPIILNGKLLALYGIYRDVTEQKKVDEQIKASLKEKEVLLREIHHRVKNNLQIINSLLKLQSQYFGDKRYVEMCKESQSRIKSMSLIHEMLYKSKHLSKINFKQYIRTLSNYLFRSCWDSPRKIALKIDSNDIYLPVDNAIPCGLIINELVSNSLKHAFPGGKKGEIKIGLYAINKKDIELVVSDDGVGIPKDLDFRNTNSLGLHLVTILAEDQLKGEIKLDRNKGTEFQIKLRGVK
jgi:PAS domain S-box-containing protein